MAYQQICHFWDYCPRVPFDKDIRVWDRYAPAYLPVLEGIFLALGWSRWACALCHVIPWPLQLWTEAGSLSLSWLPYTVVSFYRILKGSHVFILRSMDAGASWTVFLPRHRDGLPCGCVVVSWLIVFSRHTGVCHRYLPPTLISTRKRTKLVDSAIMGRRKPSVMLPLDRFDCIFPCVLL